MQLATLYRPVRKDRRVKMPMQARIRGKEPDEWSHSRGRFADGNARDQGERALARALRGERKPVAYAGKLERRPGIRSPRRAAECRSNEPCALREQDHPGGAGIGDLQG